MISTRVKKNSAIVVKTPTNLINNLALYLGVTPVIIKTMLFLYNWYIKYLLTEYAKDVGFRGIDISAKLLSSSTVNIIAGFTAVLKRHPLESGRCIYALAHPGEKNEEEVSDKIYDKFLDIQIQNMKKDYKLITDAITNSWSNEENIEMIRKALYLPNFTSLKNLFIKTPEDIVTSIAIITPTVEQKIGMITPLTQTLLDEMKIKSSVTSTFDDISFAVDFDEYLIKKEEVDDWNKKVKSVIGVDPKKTMIKAQKMLGFGSKTIEELCPRVYEDLDEVVEQNYEDIVNRVEVEYKRYNTMNKKQGLRAIESAQTSAQMFGAFLIFFVIVAAIWRRVYNTCHVFSKKKKQTIMKLGEDEFIDEYEDEDKILKLKYNFARKRSSKKPKKK